MKHFALGILLLGVVATAVSSLASSQGVSGRDVLAPTAYVSYDPVARGMPFQVAVVLKIRPGFHVNARQVSAGYLIPTDLRAEVPVGFKMADVVYPKGTLQTFSFAKDKPLNVYTDSVTIKLPLTVLSGAPLGAQQLPMKLRYQACSTEVCLPPVTKDVLATINVVADRPAARAANSEVFSQRQ